MPRDHFECNASKENRCSTSTVQVGSHNFAGLWRTVCAQVLCVLTEAYHVLSTAESRQAYWRALSAKNMSSLERFKVGWSSGVKFRYG